jgi:hypothetical protein
MFRAVFVGAVVVAAAIVTPSAASADSGINVVASKSGVATSPLPFIDGCPAGTYQAASGDCVERPDSSPSNETAICRDGTDSHSESRSGTCSRHGGVSQWCPCGSASASAALPAAAPPVAAQAADSTGAAIISYFNTHGLNYVDIPDSRAVAAKLSYSTCAVLDEGHSGSWVIANLMDSGSDMVPNVDQDRLDATVKVNAAVALVCPWDSVALSY